ncbi:hypothetical protein DEU56DRAFT_762468 [Suillus clintonianus]|uniref:uncharacterized protein n=1 Tax=Suillus clintonianus TaxID=1904413 RepID=UPI001B868D9A|nr:uncharacterized protein DEU56DRAFT_762468 [Suillus clintonianus]KAG2109146.1 hypothetical protein DEU56DRAFT_762468 [Suillus clintonianus]
MARPRLHNTTEEKAEAARTYKRAYYARHRDKLCAQKKEIYKGKEDRLCDRPVTVGRPRSHHTAEEKIEAARRSRKAYYARNREEIRIKYQNKSNSKVLDNTSSLKPARSVRDAHNKRKNKWQCDDIDASLQVLIGSSSSTALVEGLCELFIANPDKPDSLDVLRSAHNGLEDLLMRAQTVENDVLEECGTGQDLSRAHSSVSHMAPRTWLTQEELAFIATFEDDYLECQKKGNYTTFWQPFFEQWEERWPARASLFPGIPMDQVLTAAQLEENEKFKAALQKPGRKAAAAGNSAVHKLLSNIVKGPTAGRKRPLKESEVYAKKYYTTRVQASVKDELKAIKEQPDVPDPKKTNLRVIRKHVDRCWENESVEVKEEISQLTREMREAAREAAKGRKSSEVTNDLIIPRLTEILSTFFGELHEATGWTFSVLLGGPDPSNGGAIDVSSLHVGSTKLGNRFNHAFSKFNDNVMLPYYEFVSHVFPEARTSNKTPAPDDMLTNDDPPMPMPVAPDTLHGSNPTSQEADLAPILAPIFPPTHLAQEEVVPAPPEEHFYENFFQHLPPAPQDNEIDQELDRPIIPMPEGYVPFCPPPLAPLTLDPMSSPTAFLNLDSNLESFDDALKSMQSQNTTTGLVCSPPRLRYQFDNFIRFSSPSTTSVITPRTTSVGTPSTSTTSVGTTAVTTPRTMSVGATSVITPQTTSATSVITPRTMSVGTPSTTSVGTMPVITPRTTSVGTTSVITPHTMLVVTPQTTSVITPRTTVVDMPTITHSPVVRSSTTPAITPSPAAPTTTIPITTSSVAAPTTPVTLGTRPSQLISGVGLDAQNPSNVVDERPAKRQKRAQCTRAGETDPLQAVSSGRGK